jgi:hypothetical protein
MRVWALPVVFIISKEGGKNGWLLSMVKGHTRSKSPLRTMESRELVIGLRLKSGWGRMLRQRIVLQRQSIRPKVFLAAGISRFTRNKISDW